MSKLFKKIPSGEASIKTPEDRDRVVDAARALCLIVVVLGHSIMAVVGWPNGVPRLGNLLAAYPWTQSLTWVLQIMPLFFFAGGAANTLSWDKHRARGGEYSSWIWARSARLLRPVWVYLLIAGVIAALVTVLTPVAISAPLMLLTTQLLWFLGAYILVTALTPLFKVTSKGKAVANILILVTLIGLVDYLRLYQDFPAIIGLLNFVLVWALPGYLGSLRTHKILTQYSKLVLSIMGIIALSTNIVLIKYGDWPLSLVGMPGEKISNMAPPTIVLALHSFILIMLLTLLDNPIKRILSRPKVWQRVTAVNLVAMTLYLWHLPVLISLITLTHYLGLDRPTSIASNGYPVPASIAYLWGTLVFVPTFLFLVWTIVRLLWPFEHVELPWWDSEGKKQISSKRVRNLLVIFGVSGVGVSMLTLSATGLGGFPTRVINYAGLPLNAFASILLLLFSGSMIRLGGGSGSQEKPKTNTSPKS